MIDLSFKNKSVWRITQCVFCRLRSTRQFCLTTGPSRTLLLFSSLPPIRYYLKLLLTQISVLPSLTFYITMSHSLPPSSLTLFFLSFCSHPIQVRMQALKCFSVLAYENTQVSMTLVNGKITLSFYFSLSASLALPFFSLPLSLFHSCLLWDLTGTASSCVVYSVSEVFCYCHSVVIVMVADMLSDGDVVLWCYYTNLCSPLCSVLSAGWWGSALSGICQNDAKGSAHWNAAHSSQVVSVSLDY